MFCYLSFFLHDVSIFSLEHPNIHYIAQISDTSDCNWTRTHNHLARKRTLNHLAKLTKWLSVHLRAKWLSVRVQLQSLKLQI